MNQSERPPKSNLEVQQAVCGETGQHDSMLHFLLTVDFCFFTNFSLISARRLLTDGFNIKPMCWSNLSSWSNLDKLRDSVARLLQLSTTRSWLPLVLSSCSGLRVVQLVPVESLLSQLWYGATELHQNHPAIQPVRGGPV